MPPTKPVPWTGTRDALAYGPTAPQTTCDRASAGAPAGKRRLPRAERASRRRWASGRGRPVMVWLHGGGFSSGSGSGRSSTAPASRAPSDVVVVDDQSPAERVRLHLPRRRWRVRSSRSPAAPACSTSSRRCEWVRDNIDRFGGDPNLVTIFGQSGGGRKVATLMSMPEREGAVSSRDHRERRGAAADDARTTRSRTTELLLAELGLAKGTGSRAAERADGAAARRQRAPSQREAHGCASRARPPTRRRSTARRCPVHPWDPAGPAISRRHSAADRLRRTEETLYDRPTPEALALDEAGLKLRAGQAHRRRSGARDRGVRKAHPDAHAVGLCGS